MLESDILAEARMTIKKIPFMELGNFPVGKNFECPFCHYIGKAGRVSAKIYPTGLFKCFACLERRVVK